MIPFLVPCCNNFTCRIAPKTSMIVRVYGLGLRGCEADVFWAWLGCGWGWRGWKLRLKLGEFCDWKLI